VLFSRDPNFLPGASAGPGVTRAHRPVRASLTALLGVLHVVEPSSRVSPVRRTISEYALLDNGWVFDVAVLMLAAGSLAVLSNGRWG
jgi:hypothetical protein